MHAKNHCIEIVINCDPRLESKLYCGRN